MNIRKKETEHYDIETGERLDLTKLSKYIKIKSEKNVKIQRDTKYITWFTFWRETKNEPTRQGELF